MPTSHRRLAGSTGATSAAPVVLVLGGLLMAALFVPFTLAHGPTSVNEEQRVLGADVLGADMYRWGFFLGVVPCLLVAGGLWFLRERVAGERRAARVALTAICAALLLSALGDLAWRALGPPFAIFVVAPALWVAAVTTPDRTPTRLLLLVLAVVQSSALVLSLVPLETSDGFGGFRIFGSLA